MPTTISFWDHPIETLEKVLDLRKRIEALKESVVAVMGGSEGGTGKRAYKTKGGTAVASTADKRKGKRSAATRAKMAAAQQARWAAKKGAGAKAVAKPVAGAKRKKRTMSPEGRARIAAAQKARWAKLKAA